MEHKLTITGALEVKKVLVDKEGRAFIGRKFGGSKVLVVIGGETDE